MSDQNLKLSFPHTVNQQTRVLILGSLPGDRSIALQEYYGHPSNSFWWIMRKVLGEDGLEALSYDARIKHLQDHGIGLWDVIASARRSGSLDASIRSANLRDLTAFVQELPDLRAICFNGGTASRHGRRQLLRTPDNIAIIDLPSSSAAYAGMHRDTKLIAWQAIASYLDRRHAAPITSSAL